MSEVEMSYDHLVNELIEEHPELAQFKELLLELIHKAVWEVGCSWPSCCDGN